MPKDRRETIETARFTRIDRPAAGERYDIPATGGCGPHRLLVYVPVGEPPRDGWPLLLTTDGNAVFDMAVAMMRTQALDPTGSNVEEGVIVAIGYATERLYDQAGRCFDLTPPPGRSYGASEGREVRTGGAACFLAFIEDLLLPWLATLAPIDAARKTMFGHSFGGLFTLFALYHRPYLFATYAAACPSLYWEDEAIKPFENAFFENTMQSFDAKVLLSAGEWEGDELAPHLRNRRDHAELRAKLVAISKVERARALLHRFRSLAPADVATLEIFPRENHMSALPIAINRAVQTAFERAL